MKRDKFGILLVVELVLLILLSTLDMIKVASYRVEITDFKARLERLEEQMDLIVTTKVEEKTMSVNALDISKIEAGVEEVLNRK